MTVRRSVGVVIVAAVVMGACGDSDVVLPPATIDSPAATTSPVTTSPETTSPATTSPVTTTPVTTSPVGSPSVGPLELTSAGIGPVAVGSTLDELTIALGAGFDVVPDDRIRVDFPPGFRIERDGEAIFFAVSTLENGSLDLFITNSELVRLPSGIGPGSTMAEAIAAHGAPMLSFHTANEGREFVTFADGTPTAGVSIETTGGVGVYADFVDGLNETTDYDPEGRINVLWVSATG